MRTKKSINPVFKNFQYMSPQQVTLSCYMISYRRKFNMSQKEFADICSKYGKPHNIKFSQAEITNYETYKTIPTPRKFQILMNTLDIDPTWL